MGVGGVWPMCRAVRVGGWVGGAGGECLWCVGREAERHSQAKDNALCVCVGGCGVKGPACVCVGGGVCVWCGRHGWVRGQRQRPRDTARQRTTQCVCVCVCVCVCGVGGGGVRVGGGVFMGCVGRGDACVHAVWGWGGVWVCVWCVPAGGAGRDRETQPGAKEDAVCVCGYARGGCGVRAGGDRETCMDGYPASFACVS